MNKWRKTGPGSFESKTTTPDGHEVWHGLHVREGTIVEGLTFHDDHSLPTKVKLDVVAVGKSAFTRHVAGPFEDFTPVQVGPHRTLRILQARAEHDNYISITNDGKVSFEGEGTPQEIAAKVFAACVDGATVEAMTAILEALAKGAPDV